MRLTALAAVSFSLGFASAYSGDMTYYETGLGSCGTTSTDTDAIVALSVSMMNNPPNPNNNPLCGTQISIFNPATGTTTSATIVDTCEGCAHEDIDVSPSVFKAVDRNGLGDGRINVQWSGAAAGGKKMMKKGIRGGAM